MHPLPDNHYCSLMKIHLVYIITVCAHLDWQQRCGCDADLGGVEVDVSAPNGRPMECASEPPHTALVQHILRVAELAVRYAPVPACGPTVPACAPAEPPVSVGAPAVPV